MTQLRLKRWSSQFDTPDVIHRIRWTIQNRIAGEECVVVYYEGCVGLTDAIKAKVESGWPAAKVHFSNLHPSLSGKIARQPQRSPRRRL